MLFNISKNRGGVNIKFVSFVIIFRGLADGRVTDGVTGGSRCLRNRLEASYDEGCCGVWETSHDDIDLSPNQANNSTVIMDEETTSRDSFAATSPDTPSSPCVRIVLYSHLSY